MSKLDSVYNAEQLKIYPRYKYHINAGSLLSDIDGSIIVNNKVLGTGTKLDFEDNLGLKNYIFTYRLSGKYELTKKSSLEAAFMVLNRNNSIELKDSIKFGAYTFIGSAKFSFALNFSYLGLNYTYNFINKPQYRTGATAGIRYFRINTSGTGSVRVNNLSEERSFEESIWAPGLLIGLNSSVHLLPQLISSSSLEYFDIKISSIRAILFEAKLGIEYYFLKNYGLGLTALANILKINSDSEEDFNGQVSYNFKGFNLYLAVRF